MLQPLQSTLPYGQMDGLDSIYTTLLGGEVVGLGSATLNPSADIHAWDIDDGYGGNTTTQLRPVVTNVLVSGMRPLFLADEGITGYGTLMGVVVGGVCGQVVTGGAKLGPHTAAGSGKVTLWGGPGFYSITLDAVDTTGTTGLVPGNTNLIPGDPTYSKLSATTAGLLTPYASGRAFESVVVARFIEFTTPTYLVRTHLDMITALNSPSTAVSALSGPTAGTFTNVVIYFNAPGATGV